MATDPPQRTAPANRPAYATFVWAPPNYPSPDYDEPGTAIAVLYLDDVVGYLVRQEPDKMAWCSVAPPDSIEGLIRQEVRETIWRCAADEVPILDAWEQVMQEQEHGNLEDLDRLDEVWDRLIPDRSVTGR